MSVINLFIENQLNANADADEWDLRKLELNIKRVKVHEQTGKVNSRTVWTEWIKMNTSNTAYVLITFECRNLWWGYDS